MQHWLKERVLRAAGEHLASVPGMRVQVLEVPPGQAEFWPIPKGDLLIVCLAGQLVVETPEGEAHMAPMDQVLLRESERFRLKRAPQSEAGATVELIWAPGVSGGEGA
jgi:hypothetical protein